MSNRLPSPPCSTEQLLIRLRAKETFALAQFPAAIGAGAQFVKSTQKRTVIAMKKICGFVFAGLLIVTGSMAFAQKDPMVGGAAMYPSKNIVENAVNSKDHTTLVAAVKAAGLVDTLEGPGPFTVLRPPMRPSTSCRKARWRTC